MNFFDIAHEDLFRPLTGINKRRYMDILSLIWERCRRMPMYEKANSNRHKRTAGRRQT